MISDVFGLKGKLDLIVGSNTAPRCVELKTGKPHISHIGQVLIYHLLMTEKYGTSIQPELIYLEESGVSTSPVCVSTREISNIIKARNGLAHHAARKTFPDPLPPASTECKWCPVREACRVLPRYDMSYYSKRWWAIIAAEEEEEQKTAFEDIEEVVSRKNTISTYKKMRGCLIKINNSPWAWVLDNPKTAKN